MNDDFPEDALDEISKSQRKRDAQALQALGQRLIGLKRAQLDQIPLSDRVREAIEGAQRITQRIARKREMQYVGKLLRDVDAGPIEAAVAKLDATGVNERLRQHRLEQWRDALIEAGDPVLQQLVEVSAAADRQQLRQLLMTARRERDRGKPPAAARQLFKVLRELDGIDELPPEPA
ncbi:MAG: ribosome biogenesis factor YjgA [Pseudomonadota bacterium]